MNKIKYIIFASLLGGAAGAFAANGAGDPSSSAGVSAAGSAADNGIVVAVDPCPRWGGPACNFGRQDRMRQMLCNFFGDFFRPRYHHHRRAYASLPDSWGWDIPEPQFSPDCDVIETKDAYVLTMELPGISKEDIKIEVEDNVLSISGEKKETCQSDDSRVSERIYGSFVRSFSLPDDALVDNIEAECKNGVLTVKIPKKAEEKKSNVKSIKVN